MLEQYGVSGSMRDNPPLWSFRDVPSPSSISISIDGKFAGVGSKSGVVLVNQNGRTVWKNSKARRINDISISSQTGKLSVASGQKVLYLINKKGKQYGIENFKVQRFQQVFQLEVMLLQLVQI